MFVYDVLAFWASFLVVLLVMALVIALAILPLYLAYQFLVG